MDLTVYSLVIADSVYLHALHLLPFTSREVDLEVQYSLGIADSCSRFNFVIPCYWSQGGGSHSIIHVVVIHLLLQTAVVIAT